MAVTFLNARLYAVILWAKSTMAALADRSTRHHSLLCLLQPTKVETWSMWIKATKEKGTKGRGGKDLGATTSRPLYSPDRRCTQVLLDSKEQQQSTLSVPYQLSLFPMEITT
jgi:hypothetical protein